MAKLSYRVVEGWEQLPAGFTHLDCVGVDVDSQDNVYLFTRDQPRVIVYRSDGSFLRSWGEGFFTDRTHGITLGPDDAVYCVDEGVHCVYKLSPTGEVRLTIGTEGVGKKGSAASTGYDGTLESIRGGAHFNRPTNVAIAPNGDLYVSDGYGNCKVHQFSPKGEHIRSWGSPGTEPGQFNLPHGVAVAADGRVLVADRENDRVQVFSPDGEFLEQWTDVQRPTNVDVDAQGRVYVSELWWRVGQSSKVQGEIGTDQPGRASVFDSAGHLLARWGGPDGVAAGNFIAPHDICTDSRGDVYVAEVTNTFAVKPGVVPPGSHSFQKFKREA
jgi:DNA-binding beta-propeller fold protein YncE